jgi:hypothetical protein
MEKSEKDEAVWFKIQDSASRQRTGCIVTPKRTSIASLRFHGLCNEFTIGFADPPTSKSGSEEG